MMRRRSQRSASPPLSNENSSHGSVAAKTAPDTTIGRLSRDATSRGRATALTPSPSADTVLAAHTSVNGRPSRSSDVWLTSGNLRG
jgi:hypothetical protein